MLCATTDGATVVVDGRGIEVDGASEGFWLGPTLIDNVPTDSKAYGPQGVHFFTREKAITRRWLDPSHAGVNLGFPENK